MFGLNRESKKSVFPIENFISLFSYTDFCFLVLEKKRNGSTGVRGRLLDKVFNMKQTIITSWIQLLASSRYNFKPHKNYIKR